MGIRWLGSKSLRTTRGVARIVCVEGCIGCYIWINWIDVDLLCGFYEWCLAPSKRTVLRFLQCLSKLSEESLCCSRAFSACCWQAYLLGCYGQLFLHYWQTYYVFVGFLLGSIRIYTCTTFVLRIYWNVAKRVIRQMPFLCFVQYIYPRNIPPPLATSSSEWTRLPARIPGGGSTRQRCHSDWLNKH